MSWVMLAIRIMIILFLILTINPVVKGQDLQVRYLDIGDGLSNNTITSIFQDHNGFMWFGTYDGLNRFDGYKCTVFRNFLNEKNSISSNNITDVCEDARHNIWVASDEKISIYDQLSAKFTIPSYAFVNDTAKNRLADYVNCLQLTAGNIMLAGTQHNGLFYFDHAAFTARQVAITVKDGNIADYCVTAIKNDPVTNKIYVLVQGRGLYTYDRQTHRLTLVVAISKETVCLSVTRDGAIWIGDKAGLYRLDKIANSFSSNILPDKVPYPRSLFEDRKGNLWIATDGNGVWMLPASQTKPVQFTMPNEAEKPLVNSNVVYSFCEDNQQRMWIGTLRGGISILESDRNPFKTIFFKNPNKSNLLENVIYCFCEDIDHNLWIGTDGGGLRYWNRTANSFVNFRHDPGNSHSISSNFVTGIVTDGDKGLWISSWKAGMNVGGINYFNKATGKFQYYACENPATHTANEHTGVLFKDKRQHIWVATDSALHRFNSRRNSFEIFDSHLKGLQCIMEDRAGSIWAADHTSLVKIDTSGKPHAVYKIGYYLLSVYEDKKRRLWLGTKDGGLLLFDRQKKIVKQYTTRDGLCDNVVLQILEDQDGILWISTFNGLSKFDPESSTFVNFSRLDGLASDQFTYHGALSLTSGELAFGGIKGFNIFHPQHISGKRTTPPLFLTDIKINNAPIQDNLSYVRERDLDVVKKVTVPFGEASFSFDFLGLDYTNAASLNYAYFLQGWDKDWKFVKNIHTANYHRLPEGHYVFRVKVNRPGEEWSQEKELLHVTVLPPWYRTWWAYCLYVFTAIAAIYLYVLYKSNRAKLKYEVQLAQLETQKEKELNEKKIAFFVNISHEFRTPLSLIINPLKDLLGNRGNRPEEKAELKVIYRNAQRLLRLVDQLLLFKKAEADDSLNPVELDLIALCKDVYACFTEQARAKNITYLLEINEQRAIINGDREKLEIALFNILSNAFKYTPDGGVILFKIEVIERSIRISVSDSGKGIPDKEGDKLFKRFYQVQDASIKSGFGIGLYLVKRFINAHGGTVSYNSTENKGTTFTIVLPTGAQIRELINSKSTYKEISQEIALSKLTEEEEPELSSAEPGVTNELISGRRALLIIDDDNEMLRYLAGIFRADYIIYKTVAAEEGIKLARKHLPDLIISDIVMKGLNGLDLCRTLKEDETVSHIPIILLTGTSSDETQLKGMESGADDYIKKPFDKDILKARVKALLKRGNVLQNFFLNEVTLGSAKFKISPEYKEFLDNCKRVIENHFTDPQFSIKTLAGEMKMSHSNLYKKIKSVSGQTLTGFITYIRLKKSAEILINTESNVNETAEAVGFNDVKYFSKQFAKLFGVTPSEYIKKYRRQFHNTHNIDEHLKNQE